MKTIGTEELKTTVMMSIDSYNRLKSIEEQYEAIKTRHTVCTTYNNGYSQEPVFNILSTEEAVQKLSHVIYETERKLKDLERSFEKRRDGDIKAISDLTKVINHIGEMSSREFRRWRKEHQKITEITGLKQP